MKQLLLSLSLCCLFGAAAQATTVSGTVTSVASCGPVAGQKVYLTDTIMMTTFDSAVTNSAGAYSMNFPSGWTNQSYMVMAQACGAMWHTYGKYNGSNATVNLFTCGTPKTLNGTIMLGSSPSTGGTKVWLIKVQRNFPTAGDTTLTAVDSVTINGTGNYTFKMACVTDSYLVKAALLPSNSAYNSWLPSYDSSLNWSTATRYYASAFNGAPHLLFMFAGTNPGGPGFIGGSVLVGANKGTAVGDPLAARLMILVNSANNAPVAYTYTNAAGKFSFSNVAVGTYKLMGDAWGLYNVPLTVTITSTSTSVSNIIFEENYGENTFKGHFGNVGINPVSGALAGVSVYPNPASDKIALLGTSGIKGAKHVTIRNIVGAVVMTQDFAEGQPVQMAADQLPAGTYMLQLSTEAGAASFKVVK